MKTIQFLKEHIYLFSISLISFISPTIPLIIFVGFISTVDLLVAYRVNNIIYKESFSSEKSKGLLIKLSIYSVCLLTARGMDVFILSDNNLNLILKFTVGYIVIAELRSLDEKYKKLHGKFLIKEITDLFYNIVNKFKPKKNE
jgi:hypothetical protein